jgi:hypothetical protein
VEPCRLIVATRASGERQVGPRPQVAAVEADPSNTHSKTHRRKGDCDYGAAGYSALAGGRRRPASLVSRRIPHLFEVCPACGAGRASFMCAAESARGCATVGGGYLRRVREKTPFVRSASGGSERRPVHVFVPKAGLLFAGMILRRCGEDLGLGKGVPGSRRAFETQVELCKSRCGYRVAQPLECPVPDGGCVTPLRPHRACDPPVPNPPLELVFVLRKSR